MSGPGGGANGRTSWAPYAEQREPKAAVHKRPGLPEKSQSGGGKLPRIIFNYQNQPARLEPSRKPSGAVDPDSPYPIRSVRVWPLDGPGTVNPALLGKGRNVTAPAIDPLPCKRRISYQFPCAYGSGQRAHIPDPNSPPRRL